MNDPLVTTETEKKARAQLVQVAEAMINKNISFFEGARIVMAIRDQVAAVDGLDADFNVFSVIYSETDHLPYSEQRSVWSKEALAKLDSEIEQVEIWAESFAMGACASLIKRYAER